MSKSKKQTSTQKTELPSYVTDAQQTLIGAGTDLTSPFLQTPNFGVAGFTEDQLMGFDLARGMAEDAFTSGTPSLAGYTSAGPAAQAGVTNSTAAQVNGGDIQAAMNPYLGAVVDSTLGKLGQNYRDQDAQIGAQAAAAQSFGGSGEALRRSRLSDDYSENVANTTAELLAAGFDKATATALSNAQMRQQSSQANAGAANTAALQNASAANNMAQFNASGANDYNLTSAQLQEALRSGQVGRQQDALSNLLGVGGAQQQLTQTALELPYTNLQRLMGVVPSQIESTTTGTTKTSGGGGILGGLLGAGLKIGSLGVSSGGTLLGNALAGLSDEREKTDIEKVGRDPQTGEMLYAYRYKSDPKTYPKVVGPMAQDIEKDQPGRVRTVAGKKIVGGLR